VVTLALVSLMAMVAVPLYEVTSIRMKEMELRTALRQIRTALDAYKDARTRQDPERSQRLRLPAVAEVLVEGVDAAQNATTAVASANSGNGPTRLMFLRQVPRDPFTPDSSVPPEEQWDTRSYGSRPAIPSRARRVRRDVEVDDGRQQRHRLQGLVR